MKAYPEYVSRKVLCNLSHVLVVKMTRLQVALFSRDLVMLPTVDTILYYTVLVCMHDLDGSQPDFHNFGDADQFIDLSSFFQLTRLFRHSFFRRHRSVACMESERALPYCIPPPLLLLKQPPKSKLGSVQAERLNLTHISPTLTLVAVLEE